MVIYNYSSLSHIFSVFFSLVTSLANLSLRYRLMALATLSIIQFSLLVLGLGALIFHISMLTHICLNQYYLNITLQDLKAFSPLSTSQTNGLIWHLKSNVITCKLTSFASYWMPVDVKKIKDFKHQEI